MIKYIFIIFLGLSACVLDDDVRKLNAAFDKSTVEIQTRGETISIPVYLANTHERRKQGLMHVEKLPEGTGMYFVFDEAKVNKFWMKNTLIPLDILFVTSGNVVSYIEHSRQPMDETPFGPDHASLYALVINAGEARELGIHVGDVIVIQ